jgi:hypothetical protein
MPEQALVEDLRIGLPQLPDEPVEAEKAFSAHHVSCREPCRESWKLGEKNKLFFWEKNLIILS